MANPWPCRSTVGFTLNFSRQQQTEESIPRHPQWFPAGVSPQQGAHTRLVQPNRAEDDIGQNNSLDSAAISEHPWSWLSSWDFTPQGSALEWLYRSKEHPEWEGAHNRHWNPTPGLAQDIPKIPPQAMSSSLFSLPKSDEDFMLLWDIHSGLYISQHHQQHKQDIQVKKTNKVHDVCTELLLCSHQQPTLLTRTHPKDRDKVSETQVWQTARRNYSFSLHRNATGFAFPPSFIRPSESKHWEMPHSWKMWCTKIVNSAMNSVYWEVVNALSIIYSLPAAVYCSIKG